MKPAAAGVSSPAFLNRNSWSSPGRERLRNRSKLFEGAQMSSECPVSDRIYVLEKQEGSMSISPGSFAPESTERQRKSFPEPAPPAASGRKIPVLFGFVIALIAANIYL